MSWIHQSGTERSEGDLLLPLLNRRTQKSYYKGEEVLPSVPLASVRQGLFSDLTCGGELGPGFLPYSFHGGNHVWLFFYSTSTPAEWPEFSTGFRWGVGQRQKPFTRTPPPPEKLRMISGVQCMSGSMNKLLAKEFEGRPLCGQPEPDGWKWPGPRWGSGSRPSQAVCLCGLRGFQPPLTSHTVLNAFSLFLLCVSFPFSELKNIS